MKDETRLYGSIPILTRRESSDSPSLNWCYLHSETQNLGMPENEKGRQVLTIRGRPTPTGPGSPATTHGSQLERR